MNFKLNLVITFVTAVANPAAEANAEPNPQMGMGMGGMGGMGMGGMGMGGMGMGGMGEMGMGGMGMGGMGMGMGNGMGSRYWWNSAQDVGVSNTIIVILTMVYYCTIY
jgi:hypothetical protein